MPFPKPVQSRAFGDVTGTGGTVSAADGWEAPSPGNIILVVAAHSDGRALLTVPPGWDEIERNTGPELKPRPTVAGFDKIADGSETTITVAWDRDEEWCGFVREYDSDDIRIPLGRRASGGNAVGVDSIDSGNVAALLGFAFACFANQEHRDEEPTLTNGFRFVRTFKAGPGLGRLGLDLCVGDANIDGSGDYETLATWPSLTNRSSICIGGDRVFVDGESVKGPRLIADYAVQNLAGESAYVDGPGNGIELVGLNRGQARKHLRGMRGTFRLAVTGGGGEDGGEETLAAAAAAPRGGGRA